MRSAIIKNLDKMNQRLTTQDFVAKPSGPFLRDWREDVRSEALDRAPEWKGNIRSSILSQQDSKRWPLWARVFSDVPQARWMEYGTGELSEDPLSPQRAYFPSVEGVRDWAESKGFDPYLLALSIQEKGGTPPLRFFRDAERAADARLNAKLMRFGRAIEAQAAIVP